MQQIFIDGESSNKKLLQFNNNMVQIKPDDKRTEMKGERARKQSKVLIDFHFVSTSKKINE
jgi:hypothetical protein